MSIRSMIHRKNGIPNCAFALTLLFVCHVPVGADARAAESSAMDQLYDVLMVRPARNGDSYGENEIAPMIFKFSEFLFMGFFLDHSNFVSSMSIIHSVNVNKRIKDHMEKAECESENEELPHP